MFLPIDTEPNRALHFQHAGTNSRGRFFDVYFTQAGDKPVNMVAAFMAGSVYAGITGKRIVPHTPLQRAATPPTTESVDFSQYEIGHAPHLVWNSMYLGDQLADRTIAIPGLLEGLLVVDSGVQEEDRMKFQSGDDGRFQTMEDYLTFLQSLRS